MSQRVYPEMWSNCPINLLYGLFFMIRSSLLYAVGQSAFDNGVFVEARGVNFPGIFRTPYSSIRLLIASSCDSSIHPSPLITCIPSACVKGPGSELNVLTFESLY